MRLAKIALCFIYSKNLKLYGKVLQQRSYLLLKGLVFKNISRYYDKDFKITSFESSHRRFSLRKYVLRNFAKFTGKHLCQLWYQSAQVFSCEFCENSRTPFSQNTSPGDCFWSLSQYYWWLYCQIWKCFRLLRLILETTTPNNFSKFWRFSREISAVEFCYS